MSINALDTVDEPVAHHDTERVALPVLLSRLEQHENPSIEAGRRYCTDLLRHNRIAAAELREMRSVIQAFVGESPAELITTCMDGREQDHNRRRGLAPGMASAISSDGNQIDREHNAPFQDMVASVVLQSQYRESEGPALYQSVMHRSQRGHGCAAHKSNDTAARRSAQEQVETVREWYGPQIVAMMVEDETDRMGQRWHLPSGRQMDTEELISSLGLQDPSDLFRQEFLRSPLRHPTAASLDGTLPAHLLEGPSAPMYRGFRTCIPMEYLLHHEVMRSALRGDATNPLFNDRVYRAVLGNLEREDLPPSVTGHIGYQMLWATAYSLAFQRKLASLPDHEQKKYTMHAETRLFYGNGSATNDRNTAVQVRRGMGNERRALAVGNTVLSHNTMPDPHLPRVIHVNVRRDAPPHTWADMEAILAEQTAMLKDVGAVFGERAFVLPTYSVKGRWEYIPVHPPFKTVPELAPDQIYPFDCLEGTGPRTFDRDDLTFRERLLSTRLQLVPFTRQ